ncbi:MAG: patatin-like phospholipase family protein [Candidatus Margulisbacteria bacterium]|nr:patatin-like phospholipase family protein [Candidatus Margulisiibacteriota bacterium]
MFWPILGKKRIGLVLGGGVARGIAHIGVLKVIERNNIPIECIAATSSGALVGLAYAAGMEVRLIEEIALRIKWGQIFRIAFFRPGFISGEAVKDLIIKYIGDLNFSDLKIPLSIVAADIKSGEPIVISRGKTARAVAASAAVPGIVAPEEIGGHFLVDGGLGDNLPIDTAKGMGANYVVAVDVVPSKPIHSMPKDPFQMYGRAFDIVMHKMSREQRKKANILIEPNIEEDIWQLDLHKAKRLIAAGEAAALKALRGLRRKYS